ALTNALKLKADDPQTLTALGIALTKNGRGDAAIPLLSKVAALDRYDKEAFYNLGEAYEADRQWVKAAETFKFGADGRGDDPNGYFYWGVMLFNADQVVEAFDAFQKVRAIDVTAKHAGAAFYMAEIYRLRGKLQDALGQYQVVLKLKPDDAESLFQAGYLSFKLNQVDPAKDLFKKLIDVNPLHAGGAANWAAIEARFNEIRKSRKEATPGITLREVAQANPDSVEAHINLGAQLITEEVYPEAVTVLQRAVNLRPNSAAAQYNFGLALFKTGDYERSVIASAKALELKPNWADAYNNLGLAYAGLKRWEEAARAYREAVRIVPNYAGAYFNLGIAVLRMGQLDLADQLVEKLKPMDWAHQARLAHEILAVRRPGASPIVASTQVTPVVTQAVVPAGPTNNSETVAAPPENKATPDKVLPTTSSPSPAPPASSDGNVASSTPTPAPAPAPTPTPSPAEVECPEPIYRRSSVTQMASIVGPIEVPYTEEAIHNNAEGKIILSVVLCGNGRVSDITVKQGLAFGLTERAIEAMRKIQFQPAVKDSQPVTVIVEQAFTCTQRVCTAVASP
ncbi:MAG TPA: tetratricopeptide repeat protein, partial [Pyrinomonadaceae bacterium]|nr:tetratricopeptide repeat protein [Pyrinomonadaceae bacterium]